jgi:protein-tyrosine phosphatase
MKLYTILEGRIFQRGRFAQFDYIEKVDLFEANKIGLVVNLSPQPDSQLVTTTAVDYVHCPIADSPNANFKQLEEAVTYAVNWLQRHPKEALLAHCNAGRNRSSLFNACVLMELGYSARAAILKIRKARPAALATPAFVEYLERRPRVSKA